MHQLQLPPRPASAAEARRFVGRALRSVDPSTRDVAVLLTSELVTNALLYAQGRITLRIEASERAYRVVVHDESPRPAVPQRASPEATSGRGLALVELLSSSWGVERLDDGKWVWFEVPRSS